MAYTYEYPRPALTVDILLIARENHQFKVLLIQRDQPPFEGMWALPGGFVEMDETLEHAALRELEEETSIILPSLQQFYVFDAIDRDPRARTISVVFYTIVKEFNQIPRAASDARNVAFYPVDHLPDLAFDHEMIIKKAIHERIKKGH